MRSIDPWTVRVEGGSDRAGAVYESLGGAAGSLGRVSGGCRGNGRDRRLPRPTARCREGRHRGLPPKDAAALISFARVPSWRYSDGGLRGSVSCWRGRRVG